MSSRTKATFLVLFIFATGVLLGVMLVLFVVQSRFPRGDLPGRPGQASERRQEQMLGELADRLELNPGQRQELFEVLRETRREITDIASEANARGREVRRRTRERIEEILDPEQFEKFEAYRSRLQRRWQRLRPRGRFFEGRPGRGSQD